jgi:hypothetical protein
MMNRKKRGREGKGRRKEGRKYRNVTPQLVGHLSFLQEDDTVPHEHTAGLHNRNISSGISEQPLPCPRRMT